MHRNILGLACLVVTHPFTPTSYTGWSTDTKNFQDIFKQTQLAHSLIPCVPYKSQVLSLLLFLLPFLKDDKRVTSMKITQTAYFSNPGQKKKSYPLTFLFLQIICIFFHPQLCFYLSFCFVKYILKDKTSSSAFRNRLKNHSAKLNWKTTNKVNSYFIKKQTNKKAWKKTWPRCNHQSISSKFYSWKNNDLLSKHSAGFPNCVGVVDSHPGLIVHDRNTWSIINLEWSCFYDLFQMM